MTRRNKARIIQARRNRSKRKQHTYYEKKRAHSVQPVTIQGSRPNWFRWIET